jgi:hypothetical protein
MCQEKPTEKRPKGRTLEEFFDGQRKLRPAEQVLLDACAGGQPANGGPSLPEQKTENNSIRAEFLRFLALGGDGQAPVHESGVEVSGAWIEGELDFLACSVPGPLGIKRCRLDGLVLEDAELHGLFLDGSSVASINADRVHCRNCMYIRSGFRARGNVAMVRAHIEGDLDFTDGAFGEDTADGGVELWLTGARVEGRLFFRNVAGCLAVMSLRAAFAVALVDDAASWLKVRALILDGFVYDRFLDAEVRGSKGQHRHITPTDAAMRIAWLDRQRAEDKTTNFKPQPWEKLIQVLRDEGHIEESRRVAIEKQERLRRVGKVSTFAIPLHWLFGRLVGYGYRPMRTVGYVVGIWFVWGLFYSFAASKGVFAPTATRVLTDLRYAPCSPQQGGNWARCTFAPSDAPTFSPFAYSLDLIIPPLDLQQRKEWAPMVRRPSGPLDVALVVRDETTGQSKTVLARATERWSLGWLTRLVVWFENAFGWTASLLLAAVLAGLIKKD